MDTDLKQKLRDKLQKQRLHRQPAIVREHSIKKLERKIKTEKDHDKKLSLQTKLNLLEEVQDHELNKGNQGDFSSVPDL